MFQVVKSIRKSISKTTRLRILNRKSGQRGFALLVVIVVMLLTTFLASQLALQTRTELKIVHNAKTRAVERFLAEAGVQLGLFRLTQETPLNIDNEDYNPTTFQEGRLYEETSLSTGKIQYYVVNETGKIDLNKTPMRLLEIFLEYHGLDPDQIATITDSLQDWRDPDNLHRLNGAEQDHYESLEEPYIPRNGKIEDPAEFFLINGTEVLQGKFKPEEVFTVYNTTNKININNLTPAMLDFIMDGDIDKKKEFFEIAEDNNRLSSGAITSLIGNERNTLLSTFLDYSRGYGSTSAKQYYYIYAKGLAGAGEEEIEEDITEEDRREVGTSISVIVEKQNNRFKFNSWKESRS